MTSTSLANSPHSPAEILRRIALPLLLFSAVLVGLLTLSWRLLLPQLTAFAAGDAAISVSELPSYEQSLRAEISAAVARREELVLPSGTLVYDALKAERAEAMSITRVEEELRAIARTLGESDAIVLDAVWIDHVTGEAGVRGDVRDVGLRSLTVLARFVERVSQAPWVTSVQPSPFDRVTDASGVHSPFTLVIRMTSL